MPSNDPDVVATTADQVLTGLQLDGPQLEQTCSQCERLLREGDPVTVIANRPDASTNYQIDTLACHSCTVEASRAGDDRIEATAVLALVSQPRLQTHRLCLQDVSIITVSSRR